MRETEQYENVHKNSVGLTIRREVHFCTSTVQMMICEDPRYRWRAMAHDARRFVIASHRARRTVITSHRARRVASRNLVERVRARRVIDRQSVAPAETSRVRAIRSQHPKQNTLGSTLDSRRETSRDGVAESGEERERVCIRINRARGRSDRGGGVGGVHAHG